MYRKIKKVSSRGELVVKVTRLVLEAIDDGETKLDEMRKVEKMIQKLFRLFPHTVLCINVTILQSDTTVIVFPF